jgi:hypothetical protein
MTEQDFFLLQSAEDLYGELAAVVQTRKLFLLGAAFLRRVWSLLPGEGARLAVETTEQYAAGQVGVRELLESWMRAEEATADGIWRSPHIARDLGVWGWDEDCWSLGDGVCRLDSERLRECVRGTICDPAWFAAAAGSMVVELVGRAARACRADRARRQEQKEQFLLCTDIIGDPFEPRRPPPGRVAREGAVASLLAALDAAEHIDPLAMLALADALEEAGCTDQPLLRHCRQPGPHRRGCWALEHLSGRAALVLPVDDGDVWPYGDSTWSRRPRWW